MFYSSVLDWASTFQILLNYGAPAAPVAALLELHIQDFSSGSSIEEVDVSPDEPGTSINTCYHRAVDSFYVPG